MARDFSVHMTKLCVGDQRIGKCLPIVDGEAKAEKKMSLCRPLPGDRPREDNRQSWFDLFMRFLGSVTSLHSRTAAKVRNASYFRVEKGQKISFGSPRSCYASHGKEELSAPSDTGCRS
jgi:hypothetical protein